MAEATSYRKRVAKPRGQAVKSPVTKQQVDDDSPSKRQCLNDVVNESVSLTKTEVKQQKTSSKEKDKGGFRSGHPLVESGNSTHSKSQCGRSQDGRDRKEGTETRNRGLVKDSPLTPTRPAPRPPFSRNALPYASLPVAPPKPPRTYEQSPSSSLYPSLSPTLSDRTDSETNRKNKNVPVPAPRGRTKGEPVQLKETGVYASDDGKVYGVDVVHPVATQRWEKRKNAKENFPLNARDIVPEEPTRKPVSARLMEWQRKVDNTGMPDFLRMASGRQDFHAERSRKALSSALETSAPCPAPRSGARSDSSDRLFCDVGETHDRTKDATHLGSAYEKLEEPFSAVQMDSKERFHREQKDTIAVDSNAAKTPQKKRNAPKPPSTNTSNKKETKPKNRLYPDITDESSTSTHDYFVLEEPDLGVRKQAKTLSDVALPQIPLSCSLDIYGISGSVELNQPSDESSERLVPKCLPGLSECSREVSASVCGNFRSDMRSNGQPEGNGYSLAVDVGDEDDDEDENIYCEIDSPASVHGSHRMDAYERSSCQDSQLKILQSTDLHNDQHIVTKQRPVFCLESEHLVGNRSPAKPEKPNAPAMTPASPGNHRLVWSKKTGTPTITISHQMHSRSSKSLDKANDMDDLPFIPDPLVKQQLQMLQDLVYQELSVIHQTSNALAQCCHDLSAFSGSAEALECHRIILMACKKREAYVMEMQRLREARSTDDAGPLGILTVSNIRLPLKPEFMSKIGTTFDTSVHHFVVLIRHGCNVLFTQLLSTHGAMVRSSLDFPDAFEIKDIRQNSFTVDVEVYGMSVERTPGAYSSKKKKKALNPMKALTPSCTRRALSPGGSLLGSVRTSNFINIASLRLDSSHLSKVNFSLERIPFSSPLRGSIHLELGCQMESQIEERGFLTMFEDRCGFGTWYRRWCVLKCNRLLYWKYPGEEHEKEPIGFVDLKQCVSDNVDMVSRSYCARPNTFELILKRPQTKQNDGIITHEGRDEHDSFEKLWFSSDTKEERLNWCSQLNDALVNLRTWHNDAAKPDKSRKQDHDDVQPD